MALAYKKGKGSKDRLCPILAGGKALEPILYSELLGYNAL